MFAGVTWSRTGSAPWAGRYSHTSVIGAAGAIYVIGGEGSGDTYFNDVWVSADGGARPDSRRGWSGGTGWVLTGFSEILQGYFRVLQGYYGGTTGGSIRVVWGAIRELGYSMGYSMGYSRGT